MAHVYSLVKQLHHFDIIQGYLYSTDRQKGTEPALRKYAHENMTFYEILNNPNKSFQTFPVLDLKYRPLEDMVIKAVEDFGPDIVHIHHMIQIPIMVIDKIKSRLDLPIICTIRDYWYVCPFYSLMNWQGSLCSADNNAENCEACFKERNTLFQSATEHHTWPSEFLKRKETMIRSLNKVDLITFVSDYLRQQYLGLGITPEKSIVVTSGVPFKKVRLFTKRHAEGPLQIAFLGYATSIKGAYFFLESLARWKGPPIVVHFWGGIENEDCFQGRVENLINVKVITHGEYERNKIQDLLSGISVGIVPSLWPDTAPQVIFDFFASGIPIIASRIGGIPEFVRHGHNGLLFNPGDHEDLMNCLESVIQDSSFLKRLSKNVTFPRTSDEYAKEIFTNYTKLLRHESNTVPMAIELGGGETPHRRREGFLNIDFRNIPGVDVVADVKALPFRSNSMTQVYCCNIAEHFCRAEFTSLFKEWWRIICVGGWIDVIVPDIENVLDSWREMPFPRVLDALYGAQKFEGDFHYNGFTVTTLTHALRKVGFSHFPLVRHYVFDGVPRLWIRAQKRIKVALYPLGDQTVASSRIRMLNVYPFLTKKGYEITLCGNVDTTDIVVLQKRCDQFLLQSTKPFILDLDDNYFEYGDCTKEFQDAAKKASAVVVSTEYLAKIAKRYNETVYIVPTGVDSTKKGFRCPSIRENISRIVWVGYPENLIYLNKITPVIRKAGCTLRIITRDTPETRAFLRQNKDITEFCQWNIKTVDDLLLECDLGVAPLSGDGWSKAKSAHKIFKYWSLGLPVISSFSPEYQAIEDEFGVACVARSTSEWEKYLHASKEHRLQQVLKAQQGLARYRTERIASLWDSIILQTMNNSRCYNEISEIQFGSDTAKAQVFFDHKGINEPAKRNSIKKTKARAIAFYLPQFHPIPENDLWWGKGFTEWTNVAKAKPLFKGHDQPHVPADLGFYDLRLPSTREAQADLAREHGIYGFCYYHYWFGGRRLLNKPFDEVFFSGKPDFPFCLCWANERWTRAWDGRSGEILIDQVYSEEDDKKHIQWLLGVFRDKRYIRVDGKPLFLVYRANQLPDSVATTQIWRDEARRLGFGELYLCRVESFPDERSDPAAAGFDASVEFQPDWQEVGPKLKGTVYGNNAVFRYETIVERMLAREKPEYKRFPCIVPRWDNTPRRQSEAHIFIECRPDLYKGWLEATIDGLQAYSPSEDLLFINAWNEWGEGTYLEPDTKFGKTYLEATRDVLVGDGEIKFSPLHDERQIDIGGGLESSICGAYVGRTAAPDVNSDDITSAVGTSMRLTESFAAKTTDSAIDGIQRKRIRELEQQLDDIYRSRGWRLLATYYEIRDSVLWRKKRLLRQFQGYCKSREKQR